MTEFRAGEGREGTERALCFEEATGKLLWERAWAVNYSGLHYDLGPRTTPTVDGDRVYVLGAMGDLLCLRADSGKVVWRKNYLRDYGTELPTWGIVGAPLVHGDLLICLVGGQPDAKVVAFDKKTGEERWRAISAEEEPGYSSPVLLRAGGVLQLVVWHPGAVSSLNPRTGEVYWEHPFRLRMGLGVATPVRDGDRLLVSAFYNGSRMLRLDPDRPAAELIWKGNSDDERQTDGLHALVTTPVIDGDYVYGVCSYGQFRCLDARTGKRVWETMDVTVENARWASAQIVKNGGRYFINNDRGELIIARFSPDGYSEISRTRLIKPTQPSSRRRELGAVHWSHPAYANRHIVVRNDEEIVRYSLAAE